ncbi:MAG: hypothetical protein AUJ92_11635 [Armatimonadetes bacterium CG2_30_59_28]|nr:MAG: hypothetical protein AUJ92_11635 [Armatimonadetes bacterium CG2_30_59_28]PIU67475.1 MAG: hypothetical protein COS85_00545 [Armatimonadetes bacterium CG07_land_8_20_14_0_80_59_28]PIX40820.1 MAG: hypothetical protein COZ56_13720 [Armatimonadetes bacterium CG_4_8_14_3_um_filter_58_9]
MVDLLLQGVDLRLQLVLFLLQHCEFVVDRRKQSPCHRPGGDGVNHSTLLLFYLLICKCQPSQCLSLRSLLLVGRLQLFLQPRLNHLRILR